MDNWIATAVGKMYLHNISQIDLAKHLGVTNDYISMIMRRKRSPKGAKEKILSAIDEIIEAKSSTAESLNEKVKLG